MIRMLLPILLAATAAASLQAQEAVPAQDPIERLEQRLSTTDQPGGLEALARRYAAAGRHDAASLVWKRLVELRPHIGRYRLERAAAEALQGNKGPSYTELLELQGQGYAFDIGEDPRFEKVHGTEVWNYVVDGFDMNREPFGEGEVAWTLPADDLLVETLAWDGKRKQLLVGSARSGEVYRVARDGGLEALVRAGGEHGMWAVMDIAVDEANNALWVASTAIPHFRGYDPEKDLGRAGVFRFRLDDGAFVERLLSPVVPGQSFFMSSIDVAPDGTVYAADGVNNAVYVIRKGELRRLFHAPVLGGVRGLAVSGDGKRLYFADPERGILGLDLALGRPFDVRVPAKLALGGIEGLVWWDNQLIAVQNGMVPNRVMRLALSDDGRSITNVVPLEANREALSFPTEATLGDGRVFLIANSQKPAYDRFGLPRSGVALEGVRIWSLDPAFGGEGGQPRNQMQTVGGD